MNPVMEALQFARAEELAVAMDAPRSWPKEAKLAFMHLSRPLQEFYVAREKQRDGEVRRAQNEAADARKSLEEIQRQLAEMQQQLTEAQQELAELKQSKETEDGATQGPA